MTRVLPPCLLCVFFGPLAVRAKGPQAQKPTRVVYGKYYFQSQSGAKDRTENTYYLYQPPQESLAATGRIGRIPVVFQSPGNFWHRPPDCKKLSTKYSARQDCEYSGPKKHPDNGIGHYLRKGIAFVSIGYRAVTVPYWYDDAGTTKMEELIHVDKDGRLTLDTSGKTMADYRARACWMELIVKSMYDTVQALENLIANADRYNLDVHRIFFFASSAGTAQVNYLTWVYHKWNEQRYTPVGMILMNPQFDLPIQCSMGRFLKLWIDHAHSGPDLLVKPFIAKRDCDAVLGNIFCFNAMDMDCDRNKYNETRCLQWVAGCNQTWNAQVTSRYCNADFDLVTFGELYQTQVWNRDDPEVGLGMEKLWYVSQNMLDHQPKKPFYFYAASSELGTVHNTLYVRAYGEMAEKLGLNYLVEYFEQPDLNKTIVPEFDARPSELIYVATQGDVKGLRCVRKQSFPWTSMYPPPKTPVEDHVHFVSYAFGDFKPMVPQGLFADVSQVKSVKATWSSGTSTMLAMLLIMMTGVAGFVVLSRLTKGVEPSCHGSACLDVSYKPV